MKKPALYKLKKHNISPDQNLLAFQGLKANTSSGSTSPKEIADRIVWRAKDTFNKLLT